MLKKNVIMIISVILFLSQIASAESMRFGVLPVIDTLPLQVAVQEGYFSEQNLDVQLIPFTSAMERNTAVHSGQLDGFFGDLIATLLLIDKNLPIRILTISYATDPQQRMFGLVTAPGLADAGKKSVLTVAISKASIIEYLLTHIEKLPGASQHVYQPVEIMQMPIRLQMLLAGKIDSALLPEPLATLAISKGATLLATDQTLNMPLTNLGISENRLAEREAFLKAYSKAVNAINQHPESYRQLMAKTCRIPGPLVSSFPIYRYPAPRLPTKSETDQVQAWMISSQLLKSPIAYDRLVP